MNSEEALNIIKNMSDMTGVCKQAALRAVVAKAIIVGKLDIIKLEELRKLSSKNIRKFKKTL